MYSIYKIKVFFTRLYNCLKIQKNPFITSYLSILNYFQIIIQNRILNFDCTVIFYIKNKFKNMFSKLIIILNFNNTLYADGDLVDPVVVTEFNGSEVNFNIPSNGQIKTRKMGLKNGFVHCDHNYCKYMLFDVDDVKDHYATCYKPYLDDKFECVTCSSRNTSSNNLRIHILNQNHNRNGYTLLSKDESDFKLIETKNVVKLQSENKESTKRKNEDYERKNIVKQTSNIIPCNLLTK